MSAGAIFAIGCTALALSALVWFWLTRDRRSDDELGPLIFCEQVHVKVRRRTYGQYNFMSGWMSLLVYRDAIAVRSRLPRWSQVLVGGGFTLDIAICKVRVEQISRVLSMPGRGEEYVVVEGRDRRGRLELGFRPRHSTAEELRVELIRAGVGAAGSQAP